MFIFLMWMSRTVAGRSGISTGRLVGEGGVVMGGEGSCCNCQSWAGEESTVSSSSS